MKTSIILRNKMLEVASASFETPIITPTWERYIEFRKFDDTPMCRLRYESIVETSVIGDDAAYSFIAPDGTNILRGVVDISGGDVAKFLITGDTGDTLSGTVGYIGTDSDIKFNTVTWTLDTTVITIKNLRLVLPQGT